MCCHDKHRTDAVDYSLPSFTLCHLNELILACHVM